MKCRVMPGTSVPSVVTVQASTCALEEVGMLLEERGRRLVAALMGESSRRT